MSNLDIVFPYGYASRVKPNPVSDGTTMTTRYSRYGEPMYQSVYGAKTISLAEEGTYFTCTNATIGTAITGTAAPTSFSATVALMTLFNGATTVSAKNLQLLWLQLEVRAAGTNGTQFSVKMTADSVQRYTSGGTTGIAITNPNLNDSSASVATMSFGAITAAAASANVRTVGQTQLRTVIKVIGDKYLFTFGDTVPVLPGMPLEGTLQAHTVHAMPPVILPPQGTFLLHEIAASQSVAATYEFTACWTER